MNAVLNVGYAGSTISLATSGGAVGQWSHRYTIFW